MSLVDFYANQLTDFETVFSRVFNIHLMLFQVFAEISPDRDTKAVRRLDKMGHNIHPKILRLMPSRLYKTVDIAVTIS